MQAQDLKVSAREGINLIAGSSHESGSKESHTQLVSFLSEVPEPIQAAMTTFIEHHPNWDQYRLIQAALAGFLVQNGVDSRPITRLYLDNMFCSKSFGRDTSQERGSYV